jgi:hypothetical protein
MDVLSGWVEAGFPCTLAAVIEHLHPGHLQQLGQPAQASSDV